MDAKVIAPPSQYDVERKFRDLLKHGEIDELSSWLDEPYDTLIKKLNPNNPENKSDFYRAARLLWALGTMRDELAWQAIDLLVGLVFPAGDKLQLINRLQGDLERLKQEISSAAH